MIERSYQQCKRCVMDTSDVEITFDSEGFCNHCNEFFSTTRLNWFPGDHGKVMLKEIVSSIKSEAKGRPYDSILGLSGGVDSCYLALKVKELGLKPLVIHVDAGWNSELAVSNIEAVVKYCGFDLHTHVVDWEEMRDLQLSYLFAGVSNQDVPQDHIFFSSIYHFATKNKIRTILSGGNIATEGIFPNSWHGSAMDAINLKAIHRAFGKNPLRQYKTISFFEYYFWYPLVKGMRTIRPLNYLPYHKSEALTELIDTVGYKPYERKHGESLFTKFFQNYYLPTKFGFDKRRPHLSSLIVSGQLTRAEALVQLAAPLYQESDLEIDISYFCKKLQISREEFNQLLARPNRHYSEFPNWDRRYKLLKKVQAYVMRSTGKSFRVYS